MGHSLWKASEVDSDQTLHMYIVKHDPFGTAKVVVSVSICYSPQFIHCYIVN